MASNLNLQVILSLVDKLTGPMKGAAASLDQLGKEAKGAGDQLGRPVWSDHERTLGRISEQAGNWSSALSGVSSAAADAEQILRRPAWVEHGRSVVKAAEAAHSYRTAMGGVGTAISSITPAPIREQTREVERATGKVKEHAQAVGGMATAWDQAAQMAVGFAGAASGATIIRRMVGAGAAATHTDIGMATAGMTAEETAQLHAEASRLTGRYRQFSQTEIEDLLTRARAQTGSTEHAIMAAPALLEAKTVVEQEIPGGGQGFESVLRGLEIVGALKDEPTFRKRVDQITRAIEVNKGSIRAEDYSEFFQYVGSQYGPKLDDEFLKGPATTLINELRGSEAGVAIRAFENEVYRSTMYGKTAKRFEKLGLLPDKSKIHYGKGGDIKYLDPGALKNWQLALQNPDRWLNEVVMPALVKGVPNQEERDALFSGLWQTPTASQAANLLVNQRWRTQRDTALINAAPGLPAYQTWQGSPQAASSGLFAQTENFLRSGGLPLMPDATKAMNVAAGVVNLETKATEKAPWINTLLGGGLAAGGLWASIHTLMNGTGWLRAPLERVGGPLAGFGAAWEGGSILGREIVKVLGPDPRVSIREGGGGLDDGAIERSRRSRLVYEGGGYVDDPEAAHARALSAMKPEVDTAGLDAAKQKAEETGAAMKAAIEQPLAPKVETGVIDALAAKLREIAALIGIINGGLGTMHAVPAGIGAPRAVLHDGPEAR